MADERLTALALLEIQTAKGLIEEAAGQLAVSQPELAHALRNIATVLGNKGQSVVLAMQGELCASCLHHDDLISEHCGGPVLCPYACPYVEPERHRELLDREEAASADPKPRPPQRKPRARAKKRQT